MYDSYDATWCDLDCITTFFKMLPSLELFIAQEPMDNRELAVLNTSCGHSLKEMNLMIASDSVKESMLDSFDSLRRLHRLELFFLGSSFGETMAPLGRDITLPEVTTLTLAFMRQEAAGSALLDVLKVPRLNALYVRGITHANQSSLAKFMHRHQATVTELCMDGLVDLVSSPLADGLRALTKLKTLILSSIPSPSFLRNVFPAIEELRIPLTITITQERGASQQTMDESLTDWNYGTQSNFLEDLAADPPRSLRILRINDWGTYSRASSVLFTWAILRRVTAPEIQQGYLALAGALKRKGITFIDGLGYPPPERAEI